MGGGVMFYSGDLTDSFLPKFKQLNPHLMVTTGYRFTPALFSRFNIIYGSVSGADSLTSKAESRDFHFKSPIFDFNLMLGLNLNPMIRSIFDKGGIKKRFEHVPFIDGPKIMAGAGYYYFNPKAKLNDEWFALQPLGTEGQNLEGDYPSSYNRFQSSVKFGMEIGFKISKMLQIDLYGYYSMLFTDYLDDVSSKFPDYNELLDSPGGELTSEFTYRLKEDRIPNKGEIRGNPDIKDSFTIVGLKLTYSLSKTQLDQIRHK